MRGPLPVYIADPVERLRFVSREMDGLKESKQALGAEVIAGVQSFAPPTILAQASRINFSTRLFNLIVTNVPGPQLPLYVLGREMLEVYPVAFLAEGHALAVAIMSYNGQLNFGLLGDFDILPDLGAIGESLTEELATLVRTCARGDRGARLSATARSEAERELGVLGHLLRRPRRREDHLRLDRPHALELAHEFFDLLGHLGPDRTSRRGQRERHAHVAVIDLHAVDQPELDEVETELGIDHVRQRIHHVVDRRVQT